MADQGASIMITMRRLASWLTGNGNAKSRVFRLPVAVLCLMIMANVLATLVGLLSTRSPAVCSGIIVAGIACPPVLAIVAAIARRWSRRALSVAMAFSVSAAVVLLGIGFVGGLVKTVLPLSLCSKLFPREVRFPLSKVGGVVVDDSNAIYVALSAYGRIQRYDVDGQFIGGWFLETGGGDFTIWAEGDLIHAYVPRTQSYMMFTHDGGTAGARQVLFAERAAFDAMSQRTVVDNSNNTYVAQNAFWSSRILRLSGNGQQTAAVCDPLYLDVIRRPQPAWVLMLLAMAESAAVAALIRIGAIPAKMAGARRDQG
jgi:hypothetical protein